MILFIDNCKMKKSVALHKKQSEPIDPAEAYRASRRHAPNKHTSYVSASQNTAQSNAGGRITFDPTTSLSNATPGLQGCSPTSS